MIYNPAIPINQTTNLSEGAGLVPSAEDEAIEHLTVEAVLERLH